jgi:hypothetical protein
LDNLQGNNHCGGEIVSFELDIAGKTSLFRISVAAQEATLADIVPAARKISTKIAVAFLNSIKEKGQPVPCRKGCCECCSYLIPLSVPEIFCLRKEFSAMPADDRNSIMYSCMDAAKRILDKNFQTSYLKSYMTAENLSVLSLVTKHSGKPQAKNLSCRSCHSGPRK